jgi:hypothetical protein
MLVKVIASRDTWELRLKVTLFEIFKQLMLHAMLEMSNTFGKITINVPELIPLLGKLIVIFTLIVWVFVKLDGDIKTDKKVLVSFICKFI